MFNIAELTQDFDHEFTKTNTLNTFGSSLVEALNTRRAKLEQYSNGTVLLNQEQLNKVEDTMIETRHLEFIWKQVSQYWQQSTPAFVRVWKGKVEEAIASVVTSYTEVKEIVKP
jgi:hypothetical protein